jgi:hypothetical protein
MPATAFADLPGRQGNTLKLGFWFGDTDTLSLVYAPGVSFVFRVTSSAGMLRLSTTNGRLAIEGDGWIRGVLSKAEMRSLVVGINNRYELEYRDGVVEETWIAGRIVVEEGLNDDA